MPNIYLICDPDTVRTDGYYETYEMAELWRDHHGKTFHAILVIPAITITPDGNQM